MPVTNPASCPSCPRCAGSIYRIRRRSLDLLLSVFMPVHRYRCGAMGCGWEGNLRVARGARTGRGGRANDASDPSRTGRGTPSGQ